MSRLRKEIVKLMAVEGWFLDAGDIHPAVGHWRTSPFVDVYRWECWAYRSNDKWKHKKHIGCWQTMTEFIKYSKKYGCTVYDHWPREVHSKKSQ